MAAPSEPKHKRSSVADVLARGVALRRLASQAKSKPIDKNTAVLEDGTCSVTVGSLMKSEGLTFDQALEVLHRFRAEALGGDPKPEMKEHPKSGGFLPESEKKTKTKKARGQQRLHGFGQAYAQDHGRARVGMLDLDEVHQGQGRCWPPAFVRFRFERPSA